MVETEAVGHVVFPGAVGGDAHGRLVAAVVGVAQSDDVIVAGVGTRHHEGEVIGLGTGIDEVAHLQIPGHFRREFLRVLRHVGMQVDGGGVLVEFALFVARGNDVRMAVTDADGDDAAETVEVALALFVPHVLTVAFHDHERLLVIEEDARVHELLAQGQHFVGGRPGVGKRLMLAGGEVRFFHRLGNIGRTKLYRTKPRVKPTNQA